MNAQVEVLNLEWDAGLTRDRQMASLVCNYLRYRGYTVVEDSLFNWYYSVKKYNPKCVLMTNTVGALINVEVANYCYENDLPLFSMVSEGNFREKDLDQFLWGWKKERFLKESTLFLWSNRTYMMVKRKYPNLISKIKISGGVGFDIYTIQPSYNREDFFSKYRLADYKKVIGIGCWDFGFLYPEDTRTQLWMEMIGKDGFEYFDRDRIAFNTILKQIISKNVDILFIIKEHPGCLTGYKGSGIDGCEKYPNVIILKNEEPVITCMSISDFWITYESTTALEGWLLGKQTCLINPQGGDFERDKVALGSPIYTSFSQFQDAIDGFYNGGVLKGFEDKAKYRENLILDTIQWADGLNHVRVGNYISVFLNSDIRNDAQLKFSFKGLMSLLKWELCSLIYFKKILYYYADKKKRFKKETLDETSKILNEYQLRFYNDKKDLEGYECL